MNQVVFFIKSEELQKANHSTIFKLFDHSLNLLWPQGVKYDDVLLFVRLMLRLTWLRRAKRFKIYNKKTVEDKSGQTGFLGVQMYLFFGTSCFLMYPTDFYLTVLHLI